MNRNWFVEGTVRRKAWQSRTMFVVVVVSVIALSMFLSACTEPSIGDIPAETLSGATPPPRTPSESPSIPTPVAPPAEQVISFTDVSLEAVVRETINKPMGNIYVSDVKNIVSLEAVVRGIYSIGGLEYFTALESLNLRGNRILDLSPIAALTNLKSLNISGNFNVMMGDRNKGLDITPLQGLTQLEELNASENLITDIKPLARLSSLKILNLSYNRLTDISALSTCNMLEEVNLSYNFGIDNDQNEQGISSVAPLSTVTSLRRLDVTNNILMSLDGLETLINLEYLNITRNYVLSLSPLASCSSLQELRASYNNIGDLSGLAGHDKIEILDCSSNMIHYVPEILTMTSLREFIYIGNQILDYEPIDTYEGNLKIDHGE